jgi:hypothetical protein
MKNSRGLYWGGLLIILGAIWLLRSLDLIHIEWSRIMPYWPVLLVVAGVILLVGGRERGSGGLVGLLITLAVFGGIVNKTDRAFDHNDWNLGWNDHDDWDDDDHDDDDQDDNDDHDDNGDEDENDDDDQDDHDSNVKPVNGSYKYEMEDFIQKANFNLEGGAGAFTLKGNTGKLFEANTHTTLVGFVSNTTVNKNDNSATVNLKMEEGNISIKNGEIKNEAKIQLNEKPVWNIDLGIGAGKGDFDFSNYKVESLKVSTGVADMDIKMGDKLDYSKIKIESGVASVTIEIPSSIGCELRIDGALNAKTLDGLDKISNNLYRSPGYDKASKKIEIDFEGGLTSVNIKRY